MSALRVRGHERPRPSHHPSPASYQDEARRHVQTPTIEPVAMKGSIPAEVQESPAGLWHVLVQPGQEVELGDSSRLVGLHVLQVEASDEEVVAPDVFGHQVHLRGHKRERRGPRRPPGPRGPRDPRDPRGSRGPRGSLPRRCGTGWIPRRASSGSTAWPRPPPVASA